MPTPFTHLAAARQMLADAVLAPEQCALLHRERGAFYLGSIAADGHYLAARQRWETHFYRYDHMPDDPPWRVMLSENPSLWTPATDAARAFTAGYVAHLAVDEYWSRHLAAPYFGVETWGSRGFRFLMLNLLLILMDERDYAVITHPPDARADMAETLRNACPSDWLPFLPDSALKEWNLLIERQVNPAGHSETLEILAPRMGKDMTPRRLRAMLDSEAMLERDLWANVPKTVWSTVERDMYVYARDSVCAYWLGNR